MYKLYKKVNKTEDNEIGLEVIEDGNPFEQPTFLSLIALNFKLRDTNGSISRILEFAGVKTPNGEENLPLEEIPINFLGLSYSEFGNGRFNKISANDNSVRIDDDTREFVNKYILPLISDNGVKRDITECCHNMRNINIMCFCDALYMVNSINNILIEEMQKLGFTEEEIDSILSQVCIFSVGTEYNTIKFIIPNLKFSTIFVLDFKDSFGLGEEEARKVFADKQEDVFESTYVMDMEPGTIGKNSKMLIVNADGSHDLRDFIKKGIASPAIIIKVVNEILNNSLINSCQDSFVSIDEVFNNKLKRICDYYMVEKAGASKEELTAHALCSINYSSKEELSLQGVKK